MRIGILNGGGPAPGLNGVIQAVTVAAEARGWEVIGIPYGFSRLVSGDLGEARRLTAREVGGIETRGGSILYTSRANPTKDPRDLDKVVASLGELGVQHLVTVGGDDTATSAAAVAQAAGGGMRVAHVPKTIDNDLPLPGLTPTFGYETARQLGGSLCRNLRVDAQTTGRWYLVTAMGRSAGHLSLGMAMASGAELCVIREEFPEGQPVRLDDVADLVEAAILKRRAQGQPWGLAVLAEGILERLDPSELKATVGGLESDEHGNPRMSEVDLGRIVRDVVARRREEHGDKLQFVTKIIGYELRCADPCGFDVQYTRTLGAAAVRFLAEGGGDAVITLDGDAVAPLRLEDLRDAKTGRVPVRRVDVEGALWRESLPLQARLSPLDLDDPAFVAVAGKDAVQRLGHLAGGSAAEVPARR